MDLKFGQCKLTTTGISNNQSKCRVSKKNSVCLSVYKYQVLWELCETYQLKLSVAFKKKKFFFFFGELNQVMIYYQQKGSMKKYTYAIPLNQLITQQ